MRTKAEGEGATPQGKEPEPKGIRLRVASRNIRLRVASRNDLECDECGVHLGWVCECDLNGSYFYCDNCIARWLRKEVGAGEGNVVSVSPHSVEKEMA